jgi:thiol-disulfide isomerase/thioredoxin
VRLFVKKDSKKIKRLFEGPFILALAFFLMFLVMGFFVLRAYYMGYVGNQTSLELSDGSKKTIPLDQTLFYKDRLVLVKDLLTSEKMLFVFWATWCDPCIEEIKSMPAKLKALEAKGYQLVFVNYDGAQNKEKAESFISSFGMTTSFDPHQQILSALGISALPISLVVDKSGKISKILFGILNEKEL